MNMLTTLLMVEQVLGQAFLATWLTNSTLCKYQAKTLPWPALMLGFALALSPLAGARADSVDMVDVTHSLIWAGLTSLCVLDAKLLLLPSRIVMPLFPLALLVAWLNGTSPDNLLGFALGGGIFALLFMAAPNKLGWGDVRLVALLGLICGITALPFVLFLATALGCILFFTHYMEIDGKIPFGPPLILGAYIFTLIGEMIPRLPELLFPEWVIFTEYML